MSDSQTSTLQEKYRPSKLTIKPVQDLAASSEATSPSSSTATKPPLVDGQSNWNYLTLAGAYVPYPLPCSVGSSPNTRCPRPAGWCSFARLGTHHIRSGFWNSYEIHSTLPPCQICQCIWSLSRSVALFSPTLQNGNDGPSDFYTRQFLLNSTPSEIR